MQNKPPFVGREDELKALKDLLDKKTASLVFIRGRRRIGKGLFIYKQDDLTLNQALYNAALALDVQSVTELINMGADPLQATYNYKQEHHVTPIFISAFVEEDEDYPDYEIGQSYHLNAVSEVIRYEFFDSSKNGGTTIYGTKDKEKEEILILLLKVGAIPSRCIRRKMLTTE